MRGNSERVRYRARLSISLVQLRMTRRVGEKIFELRRKTIPLISVSHHFGTGMISAGTSGTVARDP